MIKKKIVDSRTVGLKRLHFCLHFFLLKKQFCFRNYLLILQNTFNSTNEALEEEASLGNSTPLMMVTIILLILHACKANFQIILQSPKKKYN